MINNEYSITMDIEVVRDLNGTIGYRSYRAKWGKWGEVTNPVFEKETEWNRARWEREINRVINNELGVLLSWEIQAPMPSSFRVECRTKKSGDHQLVVFPKWED